MFLHVASSPCTGSPVLVWTGALELFGEGLCTLASPILFLAGKTLSSPAGRALYLA